MEVKFPSLKRLAFLLLVVVPIIAWLVIKPVRVVAPTLFGISCPTSTVCVDDTSQFQNATQLYSEALTFVSKTVTPIKGSPRVIFCSSQQCAQSFGLGARAAVTVGTFGTVISPRGWRSYYVRHELIHYLQCEHLGVLSIWFEKPSWFVEGMAYGLSQDPRMPLAEPFESYRNRFWSWYRSINTEDIWQESRKL